jgi:response regulator RpfG family c-di-GMP phosphodiesterase
VGKVGIPDRILNKPGRLTPEEFAVMRRHASLGHGILCKSEQRIMRVAARIALQHHERWDGAGYPHGLSGEEISLEGRITAIVDVFDALTSRRVYREARPADEVFGTMRAGRGSQFDPELLDVFLAHSGEFAAVVQDYPDLSAERPCLGCVMGQPGQLMGCAVENVSGPIDAPSRAWTPTTPTSSHPTAPTRTACTISS